ncbi:MAG: M28 family peptidase [Telluria sp.]
MLINHRLPGKPVTAGIVAAMLALAGLAWAVSLRPAASPGAASASGQASDFSAERAMAGVRFLAQKPRPIASAANAEARQYILDQVRAMGLEPEVQTATAQKTTVDRHHNARVALGVVHNIVVRIPGTSAGRAARPATLLAANYDTTERSVGAASTAAPVAAMLESLRVLAAGAAPANDLVFLFADGERVGGLGARAFAGQHPLARRIGLVMRFDSGGSSGPLVLIGASGDNLAAVRGWARAAPHARGSSAMQAVYQQMPPAQQMGAFNQLGTARLHFANIEGGNGRGLGSRDIASRLDVHTLQGMGDTMTALARHFGNAPAGPAASGEATYFNVPGIGVVSYAAGSVWMLARLACLMFVMVCFVTWHRGDVAPGEVVDGALGFLFITAMICLASFGLWQAFPSLHEGYNARAYGAGTHDAWFLAGFAAFGTALFVLLQRGFRRAVCHAAAALGPLLCIVILLLAVSWKLPGASYMLAWPLMATLLAYGALYAPFAATLSDQRRVLILCAGVTPAVVLVAPLIGDIFIASSPEQMNFPLLTLALLLGMGTVLLTAQRRFVVRGLAAASVACFAVAGSAAPYGSEPIPQPNRMVYLKDAYTWKSYWMLPDMPLDPWSKQYFPDARRAQVQVDAFGHNSPKMWLAPAPRTRLDFPDITVLKDEDDGSRRAVRFTLKSKAAVPFIDLSLAGADVMRATLNGRVITSDKASSWSLSLYGMAGQVLDFRLELRPDTLARLIVHERIPGLPPHAIAPRPAGMLPPLTPMTETTILSDTLVFR